MGCGTSKAVSEEGSGSSSSTFISTLSSLVPILSSADFIDLQPVCSGGQGTIYSAWSHSLQRRVALKFFGYEDSSIKFQSIRDEVSFMIDCNGVPGLSQLIGLSHDSKSGLLPKRKSKIPFPIIVMPFLEGGDMLDKAGQKGGDIEQDYKRLFYQLLITLDKLHQMNYIHRDIKLENLVCESLSPNTKVCALAKKFLRLC